MRSLRIVLEEPWLSNSVSNDFLDTEMVLLSVMCLLEKLSAGVKLVTCLTYV